jgi:predicted small metal-binding protein
MFADEALRCECGYEVQASDEAGRVDEVRRHASETHGVDLSADVALEVVRRVTARAERPREEPGGDLSAVAGDNQLHMQTT